MSQSEFHDGALRSSNHTWISSFFIGLRFAHIESIDLKPNTLEFCCIVNSFENRRVGMDVSIRHVLQKDLPSFVKESDSIQESSPMKRAKRMELNVRRLG